MGKGCLATEKIPTAPSLYRLLYVPACAASAACSCMHVVLDVHVLACKGCIEPVQAVFLQPVQAVLASNSKIQHEGDPLDPAKQLYLFCISG